MDRGELKNVLGAVNAESQCQGKVRQSLEREAGAFRRDPLEWVWRHPEDEGRRCYKWDADDHWNKRRKRFDIFDIID